MSSTTSSRRAARAAHASIAALTLALALGCADDPHTPVAPEAAPRASGGVGEHGGGAPMSIAFPTARDGNREIYVMNPDGSGQTRLTFHPAEDFVPDWSPNGRQLAFVSTRDGNQEIYVMNADGSDPANLSRHPAIDGGPVFSPNGKQIAFMSQRDGNWELYVMNADGSGLTRLTEHAGPDQWPDWSSNGKLIAFQRDGDIHLLTVATGEVTRLTAHPALDDMPAFSPDGRQIAFMSQREGYAAIHVMDVDGENLVNVTPRPAGQTTFGWAMFPAWSENGRQIYFQAFRPETGPQSDVFVMNADGTDPSRLTTHPAFDGAPAAR